ncbi:MAG TPA: DUF952 domain-containing protein [Alphaproteobacteria bacterium]|nr:DUF952 domain-containing protein [Alphaproteobacteria bacterium]
MPLQPKSPDPRPSEPKLPTLIYHLADRAAWDAARARGLYFGSADDARDGFIHFSTAAEIEASAAKHRKGQANLVLLAVDPTMLGDALRWEESRGGVRFPHLYAALPVSAVRAAEPLPLGPDGRHVFPPLDKGGPR